VITVNAGFARIPAKAATAKLSATDWAVLHVIGMHADKDGRAFPSMARIAEITGIKRHNVARAIGRIEKRDLMRHDRVPRPNGGWQVNHYQLLYEPLGDVIPSDNTPQVLSTDNTPGRVFSAGTTGCSQHREQGVISSETLTDHLTTQITEEAYQEETQKEGVGLNGGGVLSTDNTKADEPAACPGPNPGTPDPADAGAEGHGQIDLAVALDSIPPAALCRWPLGDGCDKPAVPGLSLCARHGR
jgi:hypothetical protein